MSLGLTGPTEMAQDKKEEQGGCMTEALPGLGGARLSGCI